MKIQFLIDTGIPTAEVSTWEEIEDFRDKGHVVPSRDFFDLVKKLERNEMFEDEILSARANAGLPKEGLSWKDYYFNYYMESMRAYSEKESKKYQDFFSQIKKVASRIRSKMKLDTSISNQLDYLIIGGFVYPEGFPITHETYPLEPEDGQYTSVVIRIQNNISKHALQTYIDENWRGINTLVKSLPKEQNTISSERDLRIVELKDNKKLTFSQVRDAINSEFNQNGRYTLGAIKTAYYRTVKAIKATTQATK